MEHAFKVYVRIRPLIATETTNSNYNCSSNNQISFTQSTRKHTFAFERVFDQSVDNAAVYKQSLQDLIPHLFEGFNLTYFAYGMTGAGKTHTMLGESSIPNSRERGIVFLALEDLIEKAQVTFSYLEIYNEQVRDLMSSSQKHLLVLEDPEQGIMVPDLQEFPAKDINSIRSMIDSGNLRRTMAETRSNQYSTRSHAILEFTVRIGEFTSKLKLIDLAGSERASENRGQRFIEGASINRSLLSLGHCISLLADPKSRGKYIPYRNSKLTRLLKDSLGGNTITAMIACISPASAVADETLNTLKYADRAQLIKRVVTQNVDTESQEISRLKEEVTYLKSQLNSNNVSVNMKELSEEIMNNFEEHWELKNSIKEIDKLNEDNAKELRCLKELYSRSDRNNLKGITLARKMEICRESMEANEEVKQELLKSSEENARKKFALQKTLVSASLSENKKLRELEATLRDMELEKLDLHMQNQQIRQAAIKAQEENKVKDKVIQEMQLELSQIKSKISNPRIRSGQPSPRVRIHCLEEERMKRKIMTKSPSPAANTINFLQTYQTQKKSVLRKKPQKENSSKVHSKLKPSVPCICINLNKLK